MISCSGIMFVRLLDNQRSKLCISFFFLLLPPFVFRLFLCFTQLFSSQFYLRYLVCLFFFFFCKHCDKQLKHSSFCYDLFSFSFFFFIEFISTIILISEISRYRISSSLCFFFCSVIVHLVRFSSHHDYR